MRAPSTSLALTLALAACGAGADSVAPPPPPSGNGQGRVPASIAIQAGDNQEGNPGIVVAVRPAAVVRDASGQGVGGVAVTFTVQSGGGSIAGGSATTAGDGVATAGDWTLGAAEGPNTLEARVAGLPAVTFHATARATPRVVADTSIGTGGGTIRLAGTGTRYDGLELVVPGGAFSASGHWTMRVDPTRQPPPLPAGVTVSGPILVISTDQGRANRLLTLRVPVTPQPGRVNVMVMRDPQRNAVEVLPILGGDASSILVGTSHLNAGLLLGPSPAPGLRSGGTTAIFGDLDAFVASLPEGALTNIGAVLSPALNAFPIADFGSWLFPDGHGPAGAVLTMLAKALGSNPPLGTLFKPTSVPGMHLDSLTLAAVVAVARRYQAQGLKIAPVFSDVGALLGGQSEFRRDSLANLNLRAMMLFAKLPVMFMMVKNLAGPAFPAPDVGFGTAFAASDNAIQVVDPVVPGSTKSMGFGVGGFLSKVFRASGNSFPQVAAALVPLGTSSLFPVEQFSDIFQKLVGGIGSLVGEAQLPPVLVELRNASTMDWVKILGVAEARSANAEIRLRCLACPGAAPFADDPEIREIVAVDPDTRQETTRSVGGAGGGFGLGGILRGISRGALGRLLGGSFSKPVGSNINLFLSALLVPIRNRVMELDPATLDVLPNAEATFTVRNAAPGSTGLIEWKFGDEPTAQTGAPGDTVAHHVYTKEGAFTVEATLLLDGKRVASVTSTVKVVDPNKWKLVSLSGTAPAWNPVSVGTVYQQVNAFFNLLKGTPGNGTFELTPATHRMLLKMAPPAQGMPAQVVTAIGTASDCDVANSGNATGTTTSGYIFGQAVHACVKAANRDLASVVVSIDAVKSGDDLTGTITVTFTDYDGHVETELVPPKVITKFYIDHVLGTRVVTWTFSARRGP